MTARSARSTKATEELVHFMVQQLLASPDLADLVNERLLELDGADADEFITELERLARFYARLYGVPRDDADEAVAARIQALGRHAAMGLTPYDVELAIVTAAIGGAWR